MNDDGWTKLAGTVLTSTIWQEPDTTRIVWITMLALKDAGGFVAAAVPGLANVANVSIADTEKALKTLLAPDPYSRSKEHDGRRVEAVDGGWIVLGHFKYRKMRNAEERREYKRNWAKDHYVPRQDSGQSGQSSTILTHTDTDTDTTLIGQAEPRKVSWTPETGWKIEVEDMERLIKTFPLQDVMTQFNRMDAWLRANPRKAHKQLWMRFITNWLNRS